MRFIKKHIKLLIFILVIISIYLIYKLNNNNNLTYIALGDGYASGENSYGIVDYGYSDYLKDYLKKNNNLNFYTKKFSSDDIMITTLYENIIINKKVQEQDRTINIKQSLRESSIVTLSIGLNDLIYKISLEENYITNSKLDKIVNDTYKDFQSLIKEIKKYYLGEIYVIGYPRKNIKDNNLNEALRKLNNLYKDNEDVTYIDTYYIFKNNSNYLSNPNSIYPNIKGYKAISDEIITNLNK